MELHIQQRHLGAGRADRRGRYRVLLGHHHHRRRLDRPLWCHPGDSQPAFRPGVWRDGVRVCFAEDHVDHRSQHHGTSFGTSTRVSSLSLSRG